MNKLFLLITATLSLLFSNCDSSPNGEYLIYKIQPDHSAFRHINMATSQNDSIQSFLKTYLIGKKLKITTSEKYAQINQLLNTSDILLTHIPEHKEYRGQCRIYNTNLTLTLKEDDSTNLLLAVDCKLPGQKPIMLPIHELGQSLKAAGAKEARAVCYLDKI